MGHNTADTLHLITEAKKIAFADRDMFVADPGANSLPVAELISKSYGQARRALIDPTRRQRDGLSQTGMRRLMNDSWGSTDLSQRWSTRTGTLSR